MTNANKNSRLPKRVEDMEVLLDPSRLGSLIGIDASLSVQPLETRGYSGSTFYAVAPSQPMAKPTSYIVKRTILGDDWFSQRTKDEIGREGAILVAPELAKIHDLFDIPCLAVALVDGAVGMLMDDLSDWLFPDEDEPILQETETLIIDRLAEMHAGFWQKPFLGNLECLLKPADFLYILGPRDLETTSPQARSARNVDRMVQDGWNSARKLLPASLSKLLWEDPTWLWEHWNALPTTLLHGDTKLDNFAVKPNGHLALFDWAFTGCGPCTFDLAWYVAVNGSRLSRSKEELFEEYRCCLERHLGWSIDSLMWQSLVDIGVLCGALMLLWAKASAADNHRDGADREWAWWCKQLEDVSDRMSI